MCPFPRERIVSQRCWSVQIQRMLGRLSAELALGLAKLAPLAPRKPLLVIVERMVPEIMAFEAGNEAIGCHAEYYSLVRQANRKAEFVEPRFRQPSRMTGERHRRDRLIAASFLTGKGPAEMQGLRQQQSKRFMEPAELTAGNQQGMLELLGQSADFRPLAEARLEQAAGQHDATWTARPWLDCLRAVLARGTVRLPSSRNFRSWCSGVAIGALVRFSWLPGLGPAPARVDRWLLRVEYPEPFSRDGMRMVHV